MKKKIGLVFLSVIVMISLVAGGIAVYHKATQMTPVEKKAEWHSLMESGDLVNELGTEGFLKLWNALPVDERNSLIVTILRSEDLIDTLGPEGMAVILDQLTQEDVAELLGTKGLSDILSNRGMDKTLVRLELTGVEPEVLRATERKIIVKAYNQNGDRVLEDDLTPALAGVYKNMVIAPVSAFEWLLWGILPIPLYEMSNITLKAYILPDPNQDSNLHQAGVKEELGEIHVNPELNVVVVERIDPIINITPIEGYLGEYKYEDLKVGRPVYQVAQYEDKIGVFPAAIDLLYVDEEGRNLIDVRGEMNFGDLGGWIFGVFNGQLKAIGYASVVKSSGEFGKFEMFAIDINQLITYIEEKVIKEK